VLPIEPGAIASVVVLQNGTAIPGSSTGTVQGGELVGMVTIAANAGDTISIQNTFGATISLNTAQIVITKLD
jgi:hypothetical protein